MPATRYVNAVFQGGGVRGIAYVGALEKIPDFVEFKAVGGTSAGSIVAAFLATGVQRSHLRSKLSREVFRGFMEGGDRELYEKMASDFKVLMKFANSDSSLGRLAAAWSAHQAAIRLKASVNKCLERGGLYNTQALRNWLFQEFGDKKFGDIVTDELKVVAADVYNQSYRVYSKKNSPDERIANAVLASVSVPLLFVPVKHAGAVPETLVDGGLLSNFPAYLFDRSHYPTVGFTLNNAIESVVAHTEGVALLRALVQTALTAHDKARQPPNYFRNIPINTDDVSAFKFDLAADDEAKLIVAGASAVERHIGDAAAWQQVTSSTKIVRYFDLKPDQALDACARAAERFFEDVLRRPEMRPDEFQEESVIECRITENWGSVMTSNYSFTVISGHALCGVRWRIFNLPADRSIVDVEPASEAIRKNQIIAMPCANQDSQKAHLLLFNPPISAGKSLQWSIQLSTENDFTRLRDQNDDQFEFKIAPRAKKHQVNLTFRIAIPIGMRPTVPNPNFNSQQSFTCVDDTIEGIACKVYEIRIKPHELTTSESYAIKIRH